MGKRLLSKVKDVMVTQNLPIISEEDSLTDVIHTISAGRLGLALVVKNEAVVSIITDGDLRRTIERFEKNAFDLTARDFAKLAPLSVSQDTSVEHALQFMEERGVNALVVYDSDKLVGIVKK